MHISFSQLLEEIKKREHPLIGIDGFGAAGKTTLAKNIKSQITSAQIIHIDDFYKPSHLRVEQSAGSVVNEDFDWERFKREIFSKIKGNERIIRYQRYDWVSDTLQEFIEVDTRLPIIAEGVFSLQQKFFDLYDITIWVSASDKTIIERAIERDGNEIMDQWINRWQPIEKRYFQSEHPDTKAQFIISGEETVRNLF